MDRHDNIISFMHRCWQLESLVLPKELFLTGDFFKQLSPFTALYCHLRNNFLQANSINELSVFKNLSNIKIFIRVHILQHASQPLGQMNNLSSTVILIKLLCLLLYVRLEQVASYSGPSSGLQASSVPYLAYSL